MQYLAALAVLAIAVWTLGDAFVTTSDIAYQKIISEESLTILEQGKDAANDRLERLKDDPRTPAYQIREAELTAQNASRFYEAARTGNREILDSYGTDKAKETIQSLLLSRAISRLPSSVGNLKDLQERTYQVGDAVQGNTSESQRALERAVAAWESRLGSTSVRSGDELDRAMAMIETAYIIKTARASRPDIGEDDPRFINLVKETLRQYNQTEGTPLRIKDLIRGLVEALFATPTAAPTPARKATPPSSASLRLDGKIDLLSTLADEEAIAMLAPYVTASDISLSLPPDGGGVDGSIEWRVEFPATLGGAYKDPSFQGCVVTDEISSRLEGAYDARTKMLTGKHSSTASQQHSGCEKAASEFGLRPLPTRVSSGIWSGTFDGEKIVGTIEFVGADESAKPVKVKFEVTRSPRGIVWAR